MTTENWRSGVSERAERAQALRIEAAKLSQEIRAEAALVAQYRAPFLELLGRGLFADARRQVWMDVTLEAMTAAGVTGVELAMLPAHRLPAEPNGNLNAVDAFANPMTLHFPLAHGAQFLQLIEILRAQNHGTFSIDTCRIERTSAPGQPAQRTENLRAECRLSWFNLMPSANQEQG